LRLLEKATNGTVIEISVTGMASCLCFDEKRSKQIYKPYLIGTAILLRPGIILGGTLQHDCPTSRSIGYFLEPIVRLAPFAKKSMHLTLKGITTDEHDLSVRSNCRSASVF